LHQFSLTLAAQDDARFETAKSQDAGARGPSSTGSRLQAETRPARHESEIRGLVQVCPGVLAASVTFLSDDTDPTIPTS